MPRQTKQTMHFLDVQTIYFEALLRGEKTFEIREKRDRNFQIGDILVLDELAQDSWYTGRRLYRVVTYIVTGAFGIPETHVVMGLGRLP